MECVVGKSLFVVLELCVGGKVFHWMLVLTFLDACGRMQSIQ